MRPDRFEASTKSPCTKWATTFRKWEFRLTTNEFRSLVNGILVDSIMTSSQGKKTSVEVNDKVVAPSTPIDVDDIAAGSQESFQDNRYLRASKWTVFYRSVLFQMILFGW